MLSVILCESARTFFLYVGKKRVGKIIAREGGYRHRVFSTECQDNDDFRFLGYRDTLRQAARTILEDHGYGKSDEVVVKRLTGVK